MLSSFQKRRPHRWSSLLLASALGLVPAAAPRQATAVFAGGCFWGVEWVFEHVRGVKSAVAGYSGGSVSSPTYQQVGTGATGHAESVRVVYDPSEVSYHQLLEVFFLVAHDPTSLDRQGPDVGHDYRAIVFAGDSGQRREVEAYQHYAANHPTTGYIVVNDAPKLVRLARLFPGLYQSDPDNHTP